MEGKGGESLWLSVQTAAEDHRVKQPDPALLEPLAWISDLQFGDIRRAEIVPQLARADVSAFVIQVWSGLDGKPALPVRGSVARSGKSKIRVNGRDQQLDITIGAPQRAPGSGQEKGNRVRRRIIA